MPALLEEKKVQLGISQNLSQAPLGDGEKIKKSVKQLSLL